MYIGNPLIQSAFLTDQFSGNNSTTAFTMSVAPANTASVLVAVSGVLQDPSTYAVVGTTLTFTQAPPTGTGNISARYLGIPASGVTTTAYRTVTTFTATASQTTFTPPSYTVGFINVYRNGVLLTPTSDYTASNGTTVVLASGAASGDTVIVESFLVSSVLNAIPNTAGSVGSSNLASSLTLVTPTISGNLNFASGTNGIVFNNTTSGVLTNSTLNDYETGTFTPSPTAITNCSSIAITYAVYTKVGRMVYCEISGTLNITTTGSVYFIFNTPFAALNSLAGVSGTFVCGSGYGVVIDNSGLTNQVFGAQTIQSSSSGTAQSFVLGYSYTAAF